uniref:Secreted protein n=1 Tax=Knipowitschia caucasica TaxID=637954 RepID=A0AAV2JRD4_KNICA
MVCVALPWPRCVWLFPGLGDGVCGSSLASVCVALPWPRCVWLFPGLGVCGSSLASVCVALPWPRCVWLFPGLAADSLRHRGSFQWLLLKGVFMFSEEQTCSWIPRVRAEKPVELLSTVVHASVVHASVVHASVVHASVVHASVVHASVVHHILSVS